MRAWCRFQQAFDRFLFEGCAPTTCSLLRVCYATVLIVNVLVLLPDGSRWFSEQGVLRSETAQHITGGPCNSLFFLLPSTPDVIQTCLFIWLVNCVGLLLGIFSRFQAACIFFWLVSFHHRNLLIVDAQDTTMRMLAFFLIFLPLDHRWSLTSTFRQQHFATSHQAWGLRLVQIQMCLIYLSATVCKLQGETWRDGTAMFYVSQLPSFFGKWPLPDFVFESEFVVRFGTWFVLACEGILPFALWFRWTRKPALILAIGLHLGLEYSMHTFLFQWIMITGFLSFFDANEWKWRRSSPAQ